MLKSCCATEEEIEKKWSTVDTLEFKLMIQVVLHAFAAIR